MIKSVRVFLAILLFVGSTHVSKAQYERPRYAESNDLKKRNTFISIGSGMHYKYGLIGLGVGMMLNDNVLGELNVGLGAYGFKSGFTAVFNAGSNKKWRPTLGFSRASGGENLKLDIEVIHQLNNHTINTGVDLSPAYVIIPGFQRVILFRNGSNFAFDLGIAIGLNTPTHAFTEDAVIIDGSLVSTKALEFSSIQKNTFRLLQPNGLKLGMSFNFGL